MAVVRRKNEKGCGSGAPPPRCGNLAAPVAMIVEIDPASPVPPYEQLRDQIARTILSGVLAPGAQLPTIRQLASDLGLAAGTVARAYRELEQQRASSCRSAGAGRSGPSRTAG